MHTRELVRLVETGCPGHECDAHSVTVAVGEPPPTRTATRRRAPIPWAHDTDGMLRWPIVASGVRRRQMVRRSRGAPSAGRASRRGRRRAGYEWLLDVAGLELDEHVVTHEELRSFTGSRTDHGGPQRLRAQYVGDRHLDTTGLGWVRHVGDDTAILAVPTTTPWPGHDERRIG